MKLSVIMPVFNERNTLRTVVDRVLSVPLDIELICVDDGSRDGSRKESFGAYVEVTFVSVRATTWKNHTRAGRWAKSPPKCRVGMRTFSIVHRSCPFGLNS